MDDDQLSGWERYVRDRMIAFLGSEEDPEAVDVDYMGPDDGDLWETFNVTIAGGAERWAFEATPRGGKTAVPGAFLSPWHSMTLEVNVTDPENLPERYRQ